MLIRNRKFVGGASVILVLVAIAIIGLVTIPGNLRRAGSLPPRLPPGPGGLLGTDSLGRSVALQMSEAVLKSLQVGLIAASLGTFLGALLGFTSGYFGGWVDALLRVFIDVFLSVPSLLFLVLIAALVKGVGVPVMALIIGTFAWASPARQSRAQVLSLKERAFVRLARLSGVSDFQIIFGELMPNMLPWLGANFVNAFLSAILAESGLSLLGLGPQREMTLGMMIYWALSYGAILQNLWWWWLIPVVTLMGLFLSLYLIHLGLDEVSNPRLQRAG